MTDGVVGVLTPGEAPPVCCEAGVGEWLGQQILAGSTGPFGLQSRPTVDPALTAWADGSLIVENVGEFTTPHNCCESRVRNIQRIADIVRGVYLVPGETLSLNEYVGPRTAENGFIAAGAIRQGHLIQEVGGGVSQFATTIFNAAYFAGLDINEYRSHSLYFSRYPYGREATISNPAPDLVMTNTTAHPVLIWTSYTDTSITVSMYSTKNVEVAEIGQRTSSRGACTHVETDRQRTFTDGRVVVDTFIADYRPAEGIDCNGNPIPEPPL
jgi:vancomycin resistance protein YoaR